MSLLGKKCVPCEGGTPTISLSEVSEMLKQVPNWQLEKGHLFKAFKFSSFKKTIRFVNNVADLAEDEGHHPNIYIRYNKVEFEIWTHAINGLSENDFILAAKINKLYEDFK